MLSVDGVGANFVSSFLNLRFWCRLTDILLQLFVLLFVQLAMDLTALYNNAAPCLKLEQGGAGACRQC